MNSYQIIIIVLFLCSLIPTVITLFITEKVKGSIKNSFDKKLEILKKEHSIEISKFQTELNSLKAKENFKFTKLHEKRFIVLENTYKFLNETLKSLNQYVTPFKQDALGKPFNENEDKLLEKYQIAQNKFVNYFLDNKIYFDDEIEKLIDNFISENINVYNDYNENHILKKITETINPETRKRAILAYKKIPERIIPIKFQIEKKIKELLEK